MKEWALAVGVAICGGFVIWFIVVTICAVWGNVLT
jgi:hypothetical protein